MDDAAYFRDHAEHYRKLAGAFRDHPAVSTRLAALAGECDAAARCARLCACRSDRHHHADDKGRLARGAASRPA
jgi:hypothetical protein